MYRPVPEPLCPICGRAEPQLVSQRDMSQAEPPASGCELDETAYTFKCRCGVTFLHIVRHRQPSEQLTAS